MPKRSAKAPPPPARDRLHLRLSADIVTFAHSYAGRNNTTAAALVEAFFRQLKREEEQKPAFEAEQI